jgi:uncharacterized protein YciI
MFIAILKSNPDALESRARLKSAHDKYWEEFMPVLRLAGPLMDESDKNRAGQILILDVADRSKAEDIVTNDPFYGAGLFTELVINRFRISVDAASAQ